MASQIYGQIRTAFKNLNPENVRELAERPLRLGLIASGSEAFETLDDMLVPASISRSRRLEIDRIVERITEPFDPKRYDLILCDDELLCPPGGFALDPLNPGRTIRDIVRRREDLGLALARSFRPFRKPVIDHIIRTIARENALFCVVTALPDIVPSLIELPWAVGEFASDTAFLTMNQVRMAFLIAGASDHDVGFREQGPQIAGIVGGAFGWRALARELIGKVPFGGGLVPKAAIAYAGTYTVGAGLERLYRIGYGLTRAERREYYERALGKGKTVVATIVEAARRRRGSAVPQIEGDEPGG